VTQTQTETVHVACGADERYVPHLAVMLHSLCVNARDTPVHIHVMDGGLPDAAKDYLRRVVAAHRRPIDFISIDARRLQHLRQAEWFSAANYYRMLLAELLPDLARVLYLDADIVVEGDVGPLWRGDLAGCELGAVPNVLHPKNPQDHVFNLGLKAARDYLNSGVLLMDLQRMRETQMPRRLLEYAGAHPQLMLYADQDAFNGVLQGQWHRLHPRWNVQTTMLEVEAAAQPLVASELADALRQPAVIHYMGWWKPWRLWSNHPLRRNYRRYAKQLPRPVYAVSKDAVTLLEYYFPGWILLAYLRWRPRLAAVKRRIKAALERIAVAPHER
jgi:lipopolysaccharide biosynthesis glycosyltransferase